MITCIKLLPRTRESNTRVNALFVHAAEFKGLHCFQRKPIKMLLQMDNLSRVALKIILCVPQHVSLHDFCIGFPILQHIGS